MIVNKYKILRSNLGKQIDIPIEIKWDLYGQDDDLDKFQEKVVEDAIGKPKDFELARFQNKQYVNSFDTSVNYEFNFYSGLTNEINSSVITDWGTTYLPQGFTNEEIYYTTKPFLKSFFKLDFYNTTETRTQRVYFSIVLPANQSKDAQFSISPYIPPVNISIPIYNLDYVNQKEGYFLYWLKSKDFYDIDTFYMRVKFFNGSTGQFITLMNRSQASPQLTSSKYNFDSSEYLYYKVVLNYTDFTYQIFDIVGPTQVRVGSVTNPIKFYEYINPA
jgi:hypothetical protein